MPPSACAHATPARQPHTATPPPSYNRAAFRATCSSKSRLPCRILAPMSPQGPRCLPRCWLRLVGTSVHFHHPPTVRECRHCDTAPGGRPDAGLVFTCYMYLCLALAVSEGGVWLQSKGALSRHGVRG